MSSLLPPKHRLKDVACAARAGVRFGRGILAVFFLALGTQATGPASAQKLIVNSDVDLDTIDRNFARLLITMRMAQWPDKRPVTVFVLPDDNPVHESFAKRVLEVYPYQLRRTWDRQVFSGTGQAPRQVASEQEMIERVSQTAGAVGYISTAPESDQVKVLEVKQ